MKKFQILLIGIGIGIAIGVVIGFSFSSEEDLTIQDNGDFKLEYDSPLEPSLKETKQFVMDSNLFEDLISNLNQKYALPQDVTVQLYECTGEILYDRTGYSAEFKTINFCYEEVAFFKQFFESLGFTDDNKTTEFIESMTTFVFFHEVGHSLIDAHELSVLGYEEDAVDIFSALTMMDENIKLSGPVHFFQEKGNEAYQEGELNFADEHSLDLQRFYNLVCMTHGKDPEGDTLIAQLYLGSERMKKCLGEYDLAKRSWDETLKPYIKN